MLSFWEKNSFTNDIDLLVIGSGIVGLSTAIHYKRSNPQMKVVVAERDFLPNGASTKNAGFACFGSASEILSDLKSLSTEEVVSLVEMRINGLHSLRNLIGDSGLEFIKNGSYELFTDKESQLFESCIQKIDELNSLLHPIFKKSIFSIADSKINEFGFENVNHLIFNEEEGQINTGKMMVKYLSLAKELGIEIWNGLEIKDFNSSNNLVYLTASNGVELTCRKLAITVNGFAKRLLKKEHVNPARAQVLITGPIEDLKFEGTFHMEEGFYYFRNFGNRVLFGGGRNLAFDEECTDYMALTDLIQNELIDRLSNIILPKTSFRIDTQWAGVMGVSDDKLPIINKIDENVYCGIKMGGMGVAIGTEVGKKVASLVQ